LVSGVCSWRHLSDCRCFGSQLYLRARARTSSTQAQQPPLTLMAAVATLLCGSAVAAGQQRLRRRAASSLNAAGAHVSYGAHLVRRGQLRPALFPAPSFGDLSSPAPASGRLLRTPASASSSDSAGLASLTFPQLGTSALHTADSPKEQLLFFPLLFCCKIFVR
jgi:hypothetical protein